MQKIEDFLKSKNVVFVSEGERKSNYFMIRLLLTHNLDLIQNGIKIEIYRKYIILNILGWEILEKIPEDDNLNLKIFSILNSFFQKEMKIRIFLKNQKPYFWKIYHFRQHNWQLYGHHGKPLRFPWQKKTTTELDIDALILQNEGEDIKVVNNS